MTSLAVRVEGNLKGRKVCVCVCVYTYMQNYNCHRRLILWIFFPVRILEVVVREEREINVLVLY